MKWDERSQMVAGQSAMVALGLTQTALGVVLMVRLYVQDQPDSELRDIQWVLFGSIICYFALRSFLGGIMPVPTWKQALLAYGGMVTFLFVVLSLWLGLPELSEWATTILPVLLGPALLVGGYWLFAGLGRQRVEKRIASMLDD